MAQVLVQNRVALALPLLPDVVKQAGVTTRKRTPDILHGHRHLLARRPLRPALPEQLRHDPGQGRDWPASTGVGDVSACSASGTTACASGSTRTSWPSRNLTAGDVVSALREQNVQVAAGQIGQPPVPAGQDFQFTISTLGRLAEPEQFDEHRPQDRRRRPQVTCLKDVGRVELGAQNQDIACTARRPAVGGLAVFQLPGANALDTADRVKAKMEELKKQLPRGRRLRDRATTRRRSSASRSTRSFQHAARGGRPGRRRRAACSCRTGGRR